MGYGIELTGEEQRLLANIELDHRRNDHEQVKRQGPLVIDLLRRLVNRDAIPKVRLEYWTNPAYQNGRKKASRKEIFEQNAGYGIDIYTHPDFLKYLRYFLFGANLSQGVIDEFEEMFGNPEWFTSGDLVEIAPRLRRLVRDYQLHDKDEEFFRLALDYGLGLSAAQAARDIVKRVKPRP